MAVARMGCCTPLLCGTTGASKNIVNPVLTSDYQLGNWTVMLHGPCRCRSVAIFSCPWVPVGYRLWLFHRARNGHVSVRHRGELRLRRSFHAPGQPDPAAQRSWKGTNMGWLRLWML